MRTSGRTVIQGLQCLLFQIDEAEIVVHEADDPDASLDLFDAKFLTGQDVGDADALAVHADSSAGGDGDISIVQRVGELGQAPAGRPGGDASIALSKDTIVQAHKLARCR